MTNSSQAGVKEVFGYSIFCKIDERNQDMRKYDRIQVFNQIRTFNDPSDNTRKDNKSGKRIAAKRMRAVNMILHLKVETPGFYTHWKSRGTRLRIWLRANQETVPPEKIDPLLNPIHYVKSYNCGR